MSAPRSAGDPGLPLVLWEVQQTARVAARRFDEAVRAADISTAEFGVLACVNDEPGITQAHAARQLRVRPQALTGTIARLCDRAFLARDGRGRGRSAGLRLTSRGRATLDAVWPHIVDLNDPAGLGLSERAAIELCGTLDAVRQRLEERRVAACDQGSSAAITDGDCRPDTFSR